MRLLAKVTVSKEDGDPQFNEDFCAWRAAKHTWAVSDGASESFAAKRWARILALSFVDYPYVDKDWLAEASRRYSLSFNTAEMTWNKAAAFERGSFATLLGVVWHPKQRTIDIIC